MVKDPKVDAVVVDTPPNSHKEIIVAALQAKKIVITEKPITITLEDGQQWCLYLQLLFFRSPELPIRFCV
jgi:predicted dehydrogenase